MTIGLVFSPIHPEDLALDGMTLATPGSVRGMLLDVAGFPACVFGAAGMVKGHLHVLDADRRDSILTALDLQHGAADGPHRRTIVRLSDGGPLAWAWHWTGPATQGIIASGDWTRHADPRLL